MFASSVIADELVMDKSSAALPERAELALSSTEA